MSIFVNIRFEELRLDKSLKQKDIANILGVKENTYSKWENCINDISLEMCNNLANYYNVSIDYLLGISNQVKEDRVFINRKINYEKLSQMLYNIRKEKRLTQRQLAEKLGYPTNTYAQYERWQRIPTTLKLLNISNYYEISFDYLVGRTNKKGSV